MTEQGDIERGDCVEPMVLEELHRGRLDAAEARAVRKHLQRCEKCQALSAEIAEEVEFEALLREAESNLSPEQREEIIGRARLSTRTADDRSTETA